MSKLNVEVEALSGVQVTVWHPWFGAQESLFVSQVAQFNTENEWGIVVGAESKSNYSALFAAQACRSNSEEFAGGASNPSSSAQLWL